MVAAFLLVCIGFFHATLAFSACLPTADATPIGQMMGAGHESHQTDSDHAPMRVSDLLCKAHCDAENVQASFASVAAPVCVGGCVFYVVPVPLRSIILHARPPGPDIVELTAPDPVYLLSARLRV